MSARFAVGDAVRTCTPRAEGHTRLPAYLARRRGKIERVHGAFPLADARARGENAAPPEALYSVVFEGEEIWTGEEATRLTIAADLWDTYLEPDVR